MTEVGALQARRDEIVTNALPDGPFDGWGLASLRAGAGKAGLGSDAVVRAFPGGAPDAVEHFADMADRAMLARLEEMDLPGMKIRERIAAAVRVRLEAAGEHKEAVRSAASVLALPSNAGRAARSLYRTVDAMWRAAGDTSTDYNFYTKRGLLAGVYSTTFFYWLNDKSDGGADSWAFLDRRIENVMQVPKLTNRLRQCAEAPLRFAERLRHGRSASARS